MKFDGDLPPLLLLQLIQGLAIVLLWLRKPGQEASQRLDKLEEHMKHVPKSVELMELKGELRASIVTVSGMDQRMGTMASAVNRIETWLIQHGPSLTAGKGNGKGGT